MRSLYNLLRDQNRVLRGTRSLLHGLVAAVRWFIRQATSARTTCSRAALNLVLAHVSCLLAVRDDCAKISR